MYLGGFFLISRRYTVNRQLSFRTCCSARQVLKCDLSSI
jgi:hypothetical protein